MSLGCGIRQLRRRSWAIPAMTMLLVLGIGGAAGSAAVLIQCYGRYLGVGVHRSELPSSLMVHSLQVRAMWYLSM